MVIVFIFFLTFSAFGQDELEFRKVLTPHKRQLFDEFEDKLHSSKKFSMDLNQDGKNDIVRFIKKNGLDYVQIYTARKELKFEGAMETKGGDSKVYKARFVTLSNKVNCLIIYFYEGKRETHLFEAAARIYLLTIDNRNLNKISLYRAGHYFHEKLEFDEMYFLKEFTVNIFDYNDDGIKEVSLLYNKMSRVYMYLGEGKWGKL